MPFIEEALSSYTREIVQSKKSVFDINFDNNKIEVFCPNQQHEQIHGILTKIISKRSKKLNKLISAKKKVVLYHNTHLIEPIDKLHLVNYIEHGFVAYSIIDFLEKINGYTDITLLDWDYFIGEKDFSVLRNRKKVLVKHVMDYIYTILILIVTLPISIITAICIKLDSKGPIFYRQKRIGLFNQEFEVIKFRSMKVDAEKDGAQWASINDNRITRVGDFIRKTRIDEIPQFINVLRGEMSLIGPRPERQVFIDRLVEAVPFYEFRHSIKPGITGWAQVCYPYGASVKDGIWKHKFDLYYIKHQSFLFDLKIIFLTIKTIVLGLGR
jgi:exopolysaccharide biosynthesis polyprenyl glycosylphosphotransferase